MMPNKKFERNSKKSIKNSLFVIFFIVVLVVLAWVIVKDPLWWVKTGDKVTIVYTSYLDDNSVLEIRDNSNPFVFVVWSNDVISALNAWIVGMKKGKEKTIDVNPSEWFWKFYDPRRQKKVPYQMLKNFGLAPGVGDFVELWDVSGVVKKIEWTGLNSLVVLDTNSLKTWKKLVYQIKIIDILKNK